MSHSSIVIKKAATTTVVVVRGQAVPIRKTVF